MNRLRSRQQVVTDCRVLPDRKVYMPLQGQQGSRINTVRDLTLPEGLLSVLVDSIKRKVTTLHSIAGIALALLVPATTGQHQTQAFRIAQHHKEQVKERRGAD